MVSSAKCRLCPSSCLFYRGPEWREEPFVSFSRREGWQEWDSHLKEVNAPSLCRKSCVFRLRKPRTESFSLKRPNVELCFVSLGEARHPCLQFRWRANPVHRVTSEKQNNFIYSLKIYSATICSNYKFLSTKQREGVKFTQFSSHYESYLSRALNIKLFLNLITCRKFYFIYCFE